MPPTPPPPPAWLADLSARLPEWLGELIRRAAVQHPEIRSQRQLCRALGVSPNTVGSWCRNGVVPTPETIRRLAELADAEEIEAVEQWLLYEATKHPPNVANCFHAIIKRSRQAKAAGLVCFLLGMIGAGIMPIKDAGAEQQANTSPLEIVTLYIMQCLRRLRRAFASPAWAMRHAATPA